MLLNLQRAFWTGDVEFKQNKYLSPEKQIVTAWPDIQIVSDLKELMLLNLDYTFYNLKLGFKSTVFLFLNWQVERTADDEFLILACDGVW